MKINLTVDAKKVIDKLQKSQQKVKQEFDVAMAENGILLKEEIEYSIQGYRAEPRSVDTGAFLNSINIGQKSTTKENWIVVSSDVDYSSFLEYGTSRIEARPHFRNSLDRLKPTFKRKMKVALGKIIN